MGQVGRATPADLAAAARSAHAVQPAWVATPPDERAAIFRRAAAILERHHDEAALWIMRESGGLRVKANMELRSAATALHAAAAMMGEPQGLLMPGRTERLSFARRVPHGVVGVIAPFNFPLTLSIRSVAPALVTGNTVVAR
jgi:benzaldehyde dehydrogenase (NAD)